MTDDKRFFVDTNILLTASDGDRKFHGACLQWLKAAYEGDLSLYVNGQVLREYLVVATRPIQGNGLGMKPKDALKNIAEFGKCIHLLDENAGVSQRLLELVSQYKLKGKRIHDANVAATMVENGLSQLVTINGKDYEKFAEVKIIEPIELVAN